LTTGLFKRAEQLYNQEEKNITDFKLAKDKDAQYYLTMIKKGTLADKINALQLLVQKEPTRSIGFLQ